MAEKDIGLNAMHGRIADTLLIRSSVARSPGMPYTQRKTGNMQNSIDSYALHHLAVHLHRAGKHQELHRLLLSDKTWMETKFAALDSGDSPFVEDLDLAFDGFADPLTPDQLVTFSGLCAARSLLKGRICETMAV